MVGKLSLQEIATLTTIKEISDSNLETGKYGPKSGVPRLSGRVDSTADTLSKQFKTLGETMSIPVTFISESQHPPPQGPYNRCGEIRVACINTGLMSNFLLCPQIQGTQFLIDG